MLGFSAVGKDLDPCHVTEPKPRSRPRSLSSVESEAARHQRETSNHSAPASLSSKSSRAGQNWVSRSLGHGDDDVIGSRGCRGDVTTAAADGKARCLHGYKVHII